MPKKTYIDEILLAIAILSIVAILWIGLDPALQDQVAPNGNMTEVTVTEIPATLTPTATVAPTTVPIATPTPTAVPTATPTPALTSTPAPVPTATPEPKKLYVHQIAVGCANAYLIQSEGVSIVIDGGLNNTSTQKKISEYLTSVNAYPLAAYVATHYHDDHTGNMDFILSNFANRDAIVFGPGTQVKQTHRPLVQGTYRQMKNGDIIQFDNLTITCVGPQTVRSSGTINQDSLNFVLQYGEHRMFFTGDYVRSKEVLAEHEDLISNVDVFQFPHHGLEDFCITRQGFQTVNPKIVLVPANSSGPSQRLAKELGINAQFYDNRDGNIVIESDGTNLIVHTNAQPGQFVSD